ncbi:MAG: hypothetical protein QXD13_00130 [Candidatus Pacearchaeota archaeon]
MVIEKLADTFLDIYRTLSDLLPGQLKVLPPLFLLAIVIAAYGIFIWFFYRFLARRDILKLNLAKYNKFKHSFLLKFFAVVFYTIEYLLVAPIAIFLWFSIFALFFVILAKELEVATAILICAALISAVRITAYFSEDLARDLAKMFPFTLLGVIILTPGFFNMETTVSRFSQIPAFFENIAYYLLFIIMLEILMRAIYFVVFILRGMKAKEDEED